MGANQDKLKLLHECLKSCVDGVNELADSIDFLDFTAEAMKNRIVSCFLPFLDNLLTAEGFKFIASNDYSLVFYRWKQEEYPPKREALLTTREADGYIESVEKYLDLLALIKQITWIKEEILSIEINQLLEPVIVPHTDKLKWTGTSAEFGFIVDLLIQGKYLEKPAGTFPKAADMFLEHFTIDCKKSSLIKELSEATNSMAKENRNMFTIPHRETLK